MIDTTPQKHPDWGRFCYEHFINKVVGSNLIRIVFCRDWAAVPFIRYYDSEAEIDKLLEAAKNPIDVLIRYIVVATLRVAVGVFLGVFDRTSTPRQKMLNR